MAATYDVWIINPGRGPIHRRIRGSSAAAVRARGLPFLETPRAKLGVFTSQATAKSWLAKHGW